MSVEIQTEFGTALPPAPRHAITTHLPGWAMLLRFVDKDMELLMSLKSMYPRMMIHRDIKEVSVPPPFFNKNMLTKASLPAKSSRMQEQKAKTASSSSPKQQPMTVSLSPPLQHERMTGYQSTR